MGSNVDFQDLGIPHESDTTVETLVGKAKRFMLLESQEWKFLIISFVNIIIALGFTIDRIVYFMENDRNEHTVELTFAILLLFNAALCLFYAVHGVMREREYEIYVYITAIIVLFIYVIINLCFSTTHSPIKWARFGVFLILGPINIYYGYKVGMDFGYLEFKTVGASVEIQLMYRKACRFSGVLKFTVQVAVSMLILGITDCTHLSSEEVLSVSIGVPFILIWSFIGWLAMRKESKFLCWLFIVLALVEPAYIIYKIIYVADEWDNVYKNKKDNNPRWLAYSFFGASVVALIVYGCLFISLKYVMDNFGKGLRELVYSIPDTEDAERKLACKRETAKCCGIVCCGPLG